MMHALVLLLAGVAGPFGSAELVVARPIGALAEDYVGGVGAYIGAVAHVAGPYALTVRAGYIGYAPNGSNPNRRNLSVVQILGGPRYVFRDAGVSPHLGLNLGVNGVLESDDDKSPDMTLHLAWQLQLGLTIPVPGVGAIEVAGRYNAHFLEQDRMMTGFEIGIAVLF